jgi:hypothetical protein
VIASLILDVAHLYKVKAQEVAEGCYNAPSLSDNTILGT